MFLQLPEAVAFLNAVVKREWYRHSDNEQEACKYPVDDRHTIGTTRHVLQPLRNVANTGDFIDEDHEQDREPTKSIDGVYPLMGEFVIRDHCVLRLYNITESSRDFNRRL